MNRQQKWESLDFQRRFYTLERDEAQARGNAKEAALASAMLDSVLKDLDALEPTEVDQSGHDSRLAQACNE